ncbi:hypothetical protein F4604DRAFT_1926868 [Suillus subluteus]|nr:hypothetical protein F4604DRAFT_1929790 [Suillus subluteus]KAG1870086.1 hypothetical protein F4604DRAFT_1926868 [Suillus subluteus]
MTFPLTKEDVHLIVKALQLISNDEASLLKDRLLSHYSSYFPACRFEEEVQEGQSATDQLHPATKRARAHHGVPSDPHCPRRGGPLVTGARWTIGENTARSSNISAEAIIGSIASFNASHKMDLTSWISSVLGTLKARENDPKTGAGLPCLVERCLNCLSTIRSHPTISTITEFYDARITPLEPGLRPVRSSFFFWISSGVKFMLLAGGGSIYALILIAAKD